MSKHSKQSEPETTTTPSDAAAPDGPPPAGGDVVADANLKPTPGGQPDPAAQAKISAQAGARPSGNLLSELSSLPQVAALDGIRANAQAGYYNGKPAELATDLEAVTFENDEHTTVRDALVARARTGAFNGPSQ